MVLCEQLDNDKPGQMITKNAFRGSTVDELRFFDGKFTYQGSLNYTAQQIKPTLELSMWRHENIFYPACIKTLKNYLEKRGKQVNRKCTCQCIFFEFRENFSAIILQLHMLTIHFLDFY